jgi:hypothetical protein
VVTRQLLKQYQAPALNASMQKSHLYYLLAEMEEVEAAEAWEDGHMHIRLVNLLGID